MARLASPRDVNLARAETSALRSEPSRGVWLVTWMRSWDPREDVTNHFAILAEEQPAVGIGHDALRLNGQGASR
jgi:hypothetical protein